MPIGQQKLDLLGVLKGDLVETSDTLPGGWPKVLLEDGVVRCYEKGEKLVIQGENNPMLRIVLDGLAVRWHRDFEGREVLLDLHGPGDLVGIHSFMDQSRPALDSILVYSTDFKAVSISPNRCLEYWGQILHQTVEQYSRDLHMRLLLATQNSLQRVVFVLLNLSRRFGTNQGDGSLILDIGLTGNELASMAGVRRETVSRITTALEQKGLLVKIPHLQHYTISNVDRLLETFQSMAD